MRRTWTVTLLRHQQPTARAWLRLEDLVAAWNRREAVAFESVLDVMRIVTFDETTRPAMDRLVARLRETEQASGAVYDLAARQHLEAADYAQADFVRVFGVDLALWPPFVLNGESAVTGAEPCTRCGHEFDTVQSAPFAIDEARLDQAAQDGLSPGPGGWDLVSLPDGSRLASGRLARLMTDSRVRGYASREVVDAATGGVSARMVQITGPRLVLTPCVDHTGPLHPSFCPGCGRNSAPLGGGYPWLRDDAVGAFDVIDSWGGFYVSRRVADLLERAELNGVRRGGMFKVCRHG